MLNILNNVFNEYSLKLNSDKTETLILNWKLGKSEKDEVYPETILKVNGVAIKNSTSFKYLGAYTEFNNSSTGDIELGNRITSGTCKFSELKPFFKNFKIKLHIRVQYFESLVRSRLMYGCQCWVLTKAQINRLESQYIQLLRYLVKGGHQRKPEIIEYTRKDGKRATYKKLLYLNEQIKSKTNTRPLKDFYQKQQHNWIGHCVRAPDDSYIKKLTFADSYRGKPKKRGNNGLYVPTSYAE